MEQNQKLVKSSTNARSMANILHFFNLKMFRYSLFKQLKAVSSYVLVILMIIITYGLLVILFLMENYGSLETAKENVIMFKFIFFLIYFPFFTMIIAFKSVQMIRDEIDDGTLLIFNSMPYTRTRMVVEKWLSVQVVCLFYSTVILLVSTSTGYLVANVIGTADTVLNFKILFSLIDTIFLTSFIIQLLLSTFAILLSIVLSGKATTGLISLFGSIAFIGPVLTLILNSMNFEVGNITSSINYYEKAIRESGLKKYFDDSDIKQYFEFDGWANNNQSINEIQNNLFSTDDVFNIHSSYLNSTVAEFMIPSIDTDQWSKADEALKEFGKSGIKLGINKLALKTTMRTSNIKKIYGEVQLENKELHLTLFLQTNYKDVALFKKGSKLEEINQILNSVYFPTEYNREGNLGIRYSDLGIESNQLSERIIVKPLKDMIKNSRIGTDNKKEDTTSKEDELYIDNPQYYAFLNFVQKLKNIATNFRISANENYSEFTNQSNFERVKEKLEVINKYNKSFKLNNYLNIWAQWYMMWTADFRPQSISMSSMFLVPNFTANFAISEKARTYIKQDHSEGGSIDKEYEENYITVDRSTIKPIVNMIGLYSAYLVLSLLLSAGTLYLVIRKDFV